MSNYFFVNGKLKFFNQPVIIASVQPATTINRNSGIMHTCTVWGYNTRLITQYSHDGKCRITPNSQ